MADNKPKVTAKKVVGNYDKVLAVFGGMVAGKALEHLLDKTITSKPVQGLVGIELSKDLSKYVKPVIVVGTGLTVFATSKNSHMKYAGIGCAGIGMSEFANIVTGKNYLAGIDGVGFGENGFEIIDIETGQSIPPAPTLDLPELTGMTMSLGADDEVIDNMNDDAYQDAYNSANEESYSDFEVV